MISIRPVARSPLRQLTPVAARANPLAESPDQVQLSASALAPAETPRRNTWKPSAGPALALALAGLGVVGGGIQGAVAAPVQQIRVQPTLAIIDAFEGPQSHGSLVDAVLHQSTTAPTLKLSHKIREDMTGLVFTEDQAEFNQFITDVLQELPAQALRQVSQQLDKIANDPKSKVTTVNLSLAVSKAARFQMLERVAGQDLEVRSRMHQFLGLPESAPAPQFTQKLVEKVESLYDQSSSLREARQEYATILDKLEQRNVTVVVAAGNEGELQQPFQRDGIVTSPSFFTNLFSAPQTITVGAVDGAQQIWNESNPGADVLAAGVQVPIRVGQQQAHHDGTSFAAPKVASLIDQMKKLQPHLSRSQILEILRSSSPNLEVDSARALQGTLAMTKKAPG
jgi:hypothetical protein